MQKFCQAQRADLIAADVQGMIEVMATILPEVDRQTMTQNSGMGKYMVDSIREGLRISVDGWVDDDLAFIKPWGFELDEIKVPILVYQGSEDKMVPYAHGQWLAKHLPQEKMQKHLIEEEGHLSIFIGKVDDIMEELMTAGGVSPK